MPVPAVQGADDLAGGDVEGGEQTGDAVPDVVVGGPLSTGADPAHHRAAACHKREYLSIRYTERLADAGAVTSVGSHGDSYGNALAETTIGLFKTEVIARRGPWLTQVDTALAAWVDLYNHRRLHGACEDDLLGRRDQQRHYHRRAQDDPAGVNLLPGAGQAEAAALPLIHPAAPRRLPGPPHGVGQATRPAPPHRAVLPRRVSATGLTPAPSETTLKPPSGGRKSTSPGPASRSRYPEFSTGPWAIQEPTATGLTDTGGGHAALLTHTPAARNYQRALDQLTQEAGLAA